MTQNHLLSLSAGQLKRINLSAQQKAPNPYGSGAFFWRRHPDLNWGVRVLQTLALPLGHVAIFRRKVRTQITERAPFCWSGRRGSNSLPPPWQGGALPDELRPQILQFSKKENCWCLRAESNHRHGDFQSPALPSELQRQIMATRNGLEPSTSSVTG